MKRISRRSLLQSPTGPSVSSAPLGAAALEGTSRRAFLQGTAGAAAGTALILATPKVASVAFDGRGSRLGSEPKATVTKPSGPAPSEPVTAYVRSAERGEVTVMAVSRRPPTKTRRSSSGCSTQLADRHREQRKEKAMSSHREAPEISKDPVADNTDTYAFVSPDNPDTVTLITNYLPAEVPAGGPNFFEFGNDIRYAIHIDNNGDGLADLTYEFTFESTITNPDTFLYNTGPIGSLTDSNWNRRQSYNVTRVDHRAHRRDADGEATVIGTGLACPPCNIGPRSTPNYSKLAQEAVYSLPGGQTVFAGQRNDPFFVDIGSIFDLGDLRPIQNLHLIPTAAAPGVDTLQTL